MNNIELKIRDWDDEELDNCDSIAVATLKIGRTKIPLCLNCVNELHEYLNDFCRPQYCYQCKHFKDSGLGWRYGGICQKNGKDKDHMDSCDEFDEKGN